MYKHTNSKEFIENFLIKTLVIFRIGDQYKQTNMFVCVCVCFSSGLSALIPMHSLKRPFWICSHNSIWSLNKKNQFTSQTWRAQSKHVNWISSLHTRQKTMLPTHTISQRHIRLSLTSAFLYSCVADKEGQKAGIHYLSSAVPFIHGVVKDWVWRAR